MNKLMIVVFFSIAGSQSFASPGSLRSVGLETVGKDGCYLSDGKTELGSTIGLMVEAYDHHLKLPNQSIIAVMQTAINEGCNINEPNAAGLSPLNAAIVLNHSELVNLLLKNGANPRIKIVSAKKNY